MCSADRNSKLRDSTEHPHQFLSVHHLFTRSNLSIYLSTPLCASFTPSNNRVGQCSGEILAQRIVFLKKMIKPVIFGFNFSLNQ